jgi:Ser/Thr protein kinase RdoA (MazF antagonist)
MEDGPRIQTEILRLFNLHLRRVEQVVNGVNRTFLCQSSGADFYLRLYRMVGRTVPDIGAELAVLANLKKTDSLGVCRAIKKADGESIFSLRLTDNIPRNSVLFEGASGRKLNDISEDFTVAGSALRDLHAQSQVLGLAPERRMFDESAAVRTLEAFAARSSDAADAAARSLECIKELLPATRHALEGTHGFCHGDFRPANMRIDGARALLFDFDDCGSGSQWFDLATFGWWLEIGDYADRGNLWSAFVEGYSPSLHRSEEFLMTISILLIFNQVRAIQFLMEYCTLEEKSWAHLTTQLKDLTERVRSNRLKIFNDE